jgi:hypothetical protein
MAGTEAKNAEAAQYFRVPERLQLTFDLPLVVNPFVSLESIIETGAIQKIEGDKTTTFPFVVDSTYTGKIENNDILSEDIPNIPYGTWTQAGLRHKNISVNQAQKDFKFSERGLTLMEGLQFVIQHPDQLEETPLVFPGTIVAIDKKWLYSPTITLKDHQIVIGAVKRSEEQPQRIVTRSTFKELL